jgi:hypothetical protein
MKTNKLFMLILFLSFSALLFSNASITKGPDIEKKGDKVTISFTVSEKTDVEVAILDANGKVVRHLAAGIAGADKAAPPLKPDLSQVLEWDGKTDFKEKAEGGPFKVRVRAGTGVKFGIYIGAEPNNFGAVEGVAADEDGNIYMIGSRGASNQMAMTLRVCDNAGNKIIEFGKYGNFDSLYINENTELGKQKKPTVAVPGIPMAWPTGAAVTEEHIYVNDTYNRRALRVDKTYQVEKFVSVK